MAAPRPFRPASQYPLDPHLGLHASNSHPNLREEFHRRLPWTLNVQQLPDLGRQSRKDVILVLGDPHPTAVQPLLISPFFHDCLIIFATSSTSLELSPPSAKPMVHVLRTDVRLGDGAEQLVSILQNAEQQAREWRALNPRLAFNDDGSLDSSDERRRKDSVTSAATATDTKRRPTKRESKRLSKALSSAPPTTRAFDAILNFLPQNKQNKALLKHAILVTTMTQPYFVTSKFVADTISIKRRRGSTSKPENSERRWTSPQATFRAFNLKSLPNLPTLPSSTSTTSLAGSRPMSDTSAFNFVPEDPPKIIHILPMSAAASAASAAQTLQIPSSAPSSPSFGHAHLIRSMEAFLLSYAYGPLQQMQKAQNPMMPNSAAAGCVRPFILDRVALSNVLRVAKKEWTLTEMILGGALDSNGDAEFSSECGSATPTGARPASMNFGDLSVFADGGSSAWMAKRAWLANVNDLVLIPKQTHLPPGAPYSYAFNQPPIQITSPKSSPARPPRAHSRTNSGSKIYRPPPPAFTNSGYFSSLPNDSGRVDKEPPQVRLSAFTIADEFLATFDAPPTPSSSTSHIYSSALSHHQTHSSETATTSASARTETQTPSPRMPPSALAPEGQRSRTASITKRFQSLTNKRLPTPPDSGSSASDESQLDDLAPPLGMSARLEGAGSSYDSLSEREHGTGGQGTPRQSGLATPVSRGTSATGEREKGRLGKLMGSLKFGSLSSRSANGSVRSNIGGGGERAVPKVEKQMHGGSLGRHAPMKKWWTMW